MEKITKSTDTVLIDPNEPLILPDGTALVGRIEWFLYALCCLDYQNLPTPMSRIEEFANALITGEIPNIEPQSRAEQFFLAILDGNVSNLPQPQSRSEILLDKLARGEFDLSDVEPIQSRYELLLAYLIKNGGIGNIDYVLYEFSEAMKTMYNTVEKPFKSLELSGNTLVNCVLEDTENDDYTSFDKDYSGTSFTINGTSEGAIKSAILSGQTLVNLVPKKIIDHIASSDWDGYCCLVQNSKQSFDQWRALQDLKPNTKYYISCYVETFEDANNKDYCLNNPSVESIFGDSMIINGVGRYQWLSTTKSELTDEIFIVLRSQNANARGAIKIRDIMIIEYQEGMENWDIPYFEGMQSVKLPVLTTVGKNLFNDYNEFIKVNHSEKLYLSSSDTTGATRLLLTAYDENKNLITSKNAISSNSAFYHREIDNKWILSSNKSQLNAQLTLSDDVKYIVFETLNGLYMEYENIQLEEGTVATTYEPYKSNILTTTSKNLFDMNRPYDAITDSQATVVQGTNQITVASAESGIYVNANFILDKDFFAGKTVTGSCLYESDEKDIGTVQIHYQDGNGEHHYQWIRTPRTFTFPNSFIGDVMLSVSANNTGTPQSNTVTVKNIQLELGSTATSYEPYSEGVTLRGIGDVQDTLNCNTGEYVQRFGEIVLDGTQGFTQDVTSGDFKRFTLHSSFVSNMKVRGAIMCDKFVQIPDANATQEGIATGGSENYRLMLWVESSRLSTPDVAGLQAWLQQNPVTIQYELTTPIVKTVDLNVVDQNNTKIDKIHVFNETTHINASSDELTPTVNIDKSVSYPTIIKPNTKYTVDLKRNDKPLTVNLGGAEVTFTSGETRKAITTPSTLTNDKLSYYGVGAKCNEIMLIEGEVEGNIDYFTGMQSVVMQNQMPILSTVGKNLFDGFIEKGVYSATSLDKANDSSGTRYRINEPFTVEKIQYTISIVDDYQIFVRCFKNRVLIKDGAWVNQLTFDNTNGNYDKITIVIRKKDNSIIDENILFKLQIEKGSVATSYEPYKSSILSCNEDVTLRGIGDVQDTLDCLTGEMTQRIGEIVLDGSENWKEYVAGETALRRFVCEDTILNAESYNVMTNILPNNGNSWRNDITNLTIDGVKKVVIQFNSSDSRYNYSLDEFKQWLSQNPITVQYQLATESVKTVDLNVVDQDGNTIPKIKSYKDVTHLEVTVPKQSLLPNVSAEVATDNSKDMSLLTTKHQEISETQSAIQDSIQSQSDEIDTALMATTEIFESILE